MKNRVLPYLFLCISLLTLQCVKEKNHAWNSNQDPVGGGNSTSYSINKGSAVKIDALGKVTDEQGNGLPGVQVLLGSKSYTTNQKGIVLIEDGEAFSEIAYIQAKSDGYFPGSRTFVPQNGINRFEIMLLKKGNPLVFQSNEGANLREGKAEVILGAGFVDELGKKYSGEVKAYLRHLSPDHPDLLKFMPGDLRGANEDGERLLETYGMIAVELQSTTGEKLEMAEDNPATIKLEVPSSMLSRAPSTIPLWHFEEGKGIWGQEGEARLENGTYVGKVSHFSLWNCDRPYDLTRLNGTINSGIKSGSYDITITRENGEKRECKSTQDGRFGGLIPASELLTFEFWLEGERVDVKTLQTTEASQTVHNFQVNIIDPVTISGEVVGCHGTPLKEGTLLLNDWSIYPIKDGKYSFQLPKKAGYTGKLEAFYLDGTSSQKQEFVIGNNTIVIPEMSICSPNNQEEDLVISFSLDGKPYEVEGVKHYDETDSLFSFKGGRAAKDFDVDNEFLLSFYKAGAWSSSDQFVIEQFGNYGYGVIDVGDGRRISMQELNVVVLNRKPYRILFSGTYIYFDTQLNAIKTVSLTEGRISEK